MEKAISFLIFALLLNTILAWNPNAGLATNYALNASFTVSSGNVTAAYNIPNYNTNDGYNCLPIRLTKINVKLGGPLISVDLGGGW
jgi:hypothetical protein